MTHDDIGSRGGMPCLQMQLREMQVLLISKEGVPRELCVCCSSDTIPFCNYGLTLTLTSDGVLRDSSVMRLPADQFHCNPDKSNMSPSMRKMLPPLTKL